MNTSLSLETLSISNLWVDHKIESLCKKIYHNWKNDATFGYYLLEPQPESYWNLANELLLALQKDPLHHVLYLIHGEKEKDLGYILLKNYSPLLCDDPVFDTSYLPQTPFSNVEVSYRSLYSWVCARSLYEVLSDYIDTHPDIQWFLGHHAVANKASGLIFHHNGFAWLRYHHNYVYLPNIDSWSDTIMRFLHKDQYLQDSAQVQKYVSLKKMLKSQSLRLHSLSHSSHSFIVDRYDEVCPQPSSLLSSYSLR
jgi:hypothetical protein